MVATLVGQQSKQAEVEGEGLKINLIEYECANTSGINQILRCYQQTIGSRGNSADSVFLKISRTGNVEGIRLLNENTIDNLSKRVHLDVDGQPNLARYVAHVQDGRNGGSSSHVIVVVVASTSDVPKISPS